MQTLDKCLNICECLSKHKLPDKEVNIKKLAVYNKLLKETFEENNFKKLKDKHVKETFKVIDDVYFNNYLTKYLKQKNIKLSFKASYKLTSSAGLCKWVHSYTSGTTDYQLVLSAKIIEGIFSNKEKSLKINGLSCNNRLECYLNIFEHEVTHLLINLFCPERGKEMGGHTSTFRNITYNLFRHTEYKHSLLSGDAETVEKKISYFKNNVEIDDILVAENCKGNIWKGVVTKISSKSVTIIEDVSQKMYNIPWFIMKELIKHTGSKMKKVKEQSSIDISTLKKDLKVQIKFKGKVIDAVIISVGQKRVKVVLEDGKMWYVPLSFLIL